ncbi:ribonucleotide reductase N-terminal alpha domain-containing protein [Alkalihalobacillus sp. NPDC078783]
MSETSGLPNWVQKNNQIMIQKDGVYQFEKDKEAVHDYFVENINMNTVYFHDLEEKIKYLLNNDYYEREFLEEYTMEEIKSVYKFCYDKKFRFPSYMSAFKFYNDYALKTNDKKKILERYEDRVAIVALYLAKGSVDKAIEYAEVMINQEYQPSTPTFLNAGRSRRGEMVSCFLLEVGDSLNDISKALETSMQLSKMGGGVALNLSKLRAKGEAIKDIANATKGVVGVMKLFDNAFRYADQMSQRQGSGAVYLNIFHADINDFLDTKKISADEDVRVKTLSIGVVIPDKFVELAKEDKDAYVFYPHTIYKEYGEYLDELDMNEVYDDLVNNPNVRKDKINARKLLQKLAMLRSESGYPYIMFEDNVNKDHANNHISKVKFSNLCVTGDTLLSTSKGQVSAKELYESKEDLKVTIDNRTKKHNLDEKGTSLVDAIPMHLTKKEAEVHRIKTKQGFEIKATPWHKFYVKAGDVVEKRALHELKVGDRLLVQSDEGNFGDIHEPELAYIMGIIAADGTFGDKTVKVYLYDNKKHLADKVEKLIAGVIKKYRNLCSNHHSTNYAPHFNASNSELQDLLHLSSSALTSILKVFGMTKENKTRVPQFLYKADKETQTAYLSGLFQMDACVNANFKCKALTIELTSIHYESLQDVQQLITNLGVYSTIYSNFKRDKELLPDGKGGTALYNVKPVHKLNIQDRISRERFVKGVELKEYDMYKFNMLTDTLQPKSRNPKHNFSAEISEIEFHGYEDVYDTTQKDYSSLIFNGIVTGNCSEVLQASKLSTYNDYGMEDEIGLDISCNLGSLNIVNVMNNKSIKTAVKTAVDALTMISESTDIKNAPAVKRANNAMKSIGLGAMNLHGYLASNHIMYESKEARDFANTFFMMVNFYTLERSMELAKETGETYENYEGSTYSTGEYFSKYINNSYLPKSQIITKLFEGQNVPTQKDWLQLSEKVAEHGLFHSYRQCVAPTGSISYVQSSTASVMPIMEQIEERTYGNSKSYYPMPLISRTNWFFYKPAYDMNMLRVVDMVATIQQHVDQGISFTLFLTDTMTTRDVNKIDMYAHHRGIKTIYYARTKDTEQEGCLSCTV